MLLLCIIRTFLSQTCSNYRRNTTDYLTTIKMTLLNSMDEFNFFNWIWCFEAMFVMIFYGLIIIISVLIQYQIRYFGRERDEAQSKKVIANNSPWTKPVNLSTKSISLLALPIINWLIFRFSFESINSYSWTAKFIGTMVQLIVDSVGCIPQIIVIDRARSMIQYTIAFITIDVANMIFRIITVCLREHNQAITLVLFTCLILFQLMMIMIKLYFFCSEMLMDNEGRLELQSDNKSNGEYFETVSKRKRGKEMV